MGIASDPNKKRGRNLPEIMLTTFPHTIYQYDTYVFNAPTIFVTIELSHLLLVTSLNLRSVLILNTRDVFAVVYSRVDSYDDSHMDMGSTT